jgi:hypothetical protein
MEREEIKTLLASIEQQVSSSILGGMEETYEELERLGLILYHKDNAHPSATITQKGEDYLHNDNNESIITG